MNTIFQKAGVKEKLEGNFAFPLKLNFLLEYIEGNTKLSASEEKELFKILVNNDNLAFHFFKALEDPAFLDKTYKDLIEPIVKTPSNRNVKTLIIDYLELCSSNSEEQVVSLLRNLVESTSAPSIIQNLINSVRKYDLSKNTLFNFSVYLADRFHKHPVPDIRLATVQLLAKIGEFDQNNATGFLSAIKTFQPEPKDETRGGQILSITFSGKDLERMVNDEILRTTIHLIKFAKRNSKPVTENLTNLAELLYEEVETIRFAQSKEEQELIEILGKENPEEKYKMYDVVETEWQTVEEKDANDEFDLTILKDHPRDFELMQRLQSNISKNPALILSILENFNEVPEFHRTPALFSYMNRDEVTYIEFFLLINHRNFPSSEEHIVEQATKSLLRLVQRSVREKENLENSLVERIKNLCTNWYTNHPETVLKTKKTDNADSVLFDGVNSARGSCLTIFSLLAYYKKDNSFIKLIFELAKDADLVEKAMINYNLNLIAFTDYESAVVLFEQTSIPRNKYIHYSLLRFFSSLNPERFSVYFKYIESIIESEKDEEVQGKYGELIGYRTIEDGFDVADITDRIIRGEVGNKNTRSSIAFILESNLAKCLGKGKDDILDLINKMLAFEQDWSVVERIAFMFVRSELSTDYLDKLSSVIDNLITHQKNHASGHSHLIQYLQRCLSNGHRKTVLHITAEMLRKGSVILQENLGAEKIAQIGRTCLELLPELDLEEKTDLKFILEAGLEIGWESFGSIFKTMKESFMKLIEEVSPSDSPL